MRTVEELAAMSLEDTREELEWMKSCAREAWETCGQGTSSKEVVRMRFLEFKLGLHEKLGWTEERILAIPDLWEFWQSGMRLFN